MTNCSWVQKYGRHGPTVIYTRRLRDLWRRRYWVYCWGCDDKWGPYADAWFAQQMWHTVDNLVPARLGNIEKHCNAEKWDSYGAAPVTDEAIEAARKMCTSLDVVPTVNGGIQVGMLSEAVTLELDAAGKITNVYCAGLFEWDDEGGFTPETGDKQP